ncbi:MAG: ASKHA domain-containing protein [Candidatus Thorarchaeota archaeon]
MTGPVITFQPSGKRITMKKGCTILEAAHSLGIPIRAECGGKGLCGKCKVQIKKVPSTDQELVDEDEIQSAFLSESELNQGYRLACKVTIDDDVTVYIPDDSLLKKQRILIEGVSRKIILDPYIKKIFLKLPEPSLEDNRSDMERIRDSLEYNIARVSLETLQKVPLTLRESNYEVTLVLLGDELVECERGDTTDRCFGVAFDIGTTTVVGYLVDLNSGEEHAVCARMNPQIRFGDDVISRINFGQNEENLQKLSESLKTCLVDIINELCTRSQIRSEEIYEISIAGNSCMHHLFLGISPRSLAVSPYIPVVKESLYLPSTIYGKKMYILPVIAGFVGADTVADLIAYPLGKKPKLLIDIGTNCEVILGNEDKILACSTAAGPAFEGAHIKHGMRAAPGAIEEISIDEEITLTTIDDDPPQGIAGSGLISITAEMLKNGIISTAGRLLTDHEFSSRITVVENTKEFMLSDTISLTQKDLREVQLAKSAIFAAQRILLKTYGINQEELEEIVLAGAFGNYIPLLSAKIIGLILDIPLEKIKSIGNAAGTGATLCLLSKKERKRARSLSEDIHYVELSTRKDFQEEFINAMFFPHSQMDLFPSVQAILNQR